MKKVIITGNLTKDVELRKVKKGEDEFSVATITVAVNEIGSETPTFFNIEVFRGLADSCAKNIGKGAAVSIIAEIKSNNYEKNGEKVYGYKFIAEEIQFITRTKKGEE